MSSEARDDELNIVPLLRQMNGNKVSLYLLEDQEEEYAKIWLEVFQAFARLGNCELDVLWQKSPWAWRLTGTWDASALVAGKEVAILDDLSDSRASYNITVSSDGIASPPLKIETSETRRSTEFLALLFDNQIGDRSVFPADKNTGESLDADRADHNTLGQRYGDAIIERQPVMAARAAVFTSWGRTSEPSRYIEIRDKTHKRDIGSLTLVSSPELRWLLGVYDRWRPSAHGKVVVCRDHALAHEVDLTALYERWGDVLAFAPNVRTQLSRAKLAGARAAIILLDECNDSAIKLVIDLATKHCFPVFVFAKTFSKDLSRHSAGFLVHYAPFPADQTMRDALIDEVIDRCWRLPAHPTPGVERPAFEACVQSARDRGHVEIVGEDAAAWWPAVVNLDFASAPEDVIPWQAFVAGWRKFQVTDGGAARSHRIGRESDKDQIDEFTFLPEAKTPTRGRYAWASAHMREIANKVKALTVGTDRNVNLLLLGETGVGKEVVAKYVWGRLFQAAENPFVAINCAAIPATLLESELFGSVKGAFDGAQNRPGKIRTADAGGKGGLLLLDEIGDMPLGLQAKLLRVIQERKVTPLGSDTEFPVKVAIVAATNLNLRRAIAEGSFRSDLAQRLGDPIWIPPLRDRPADIEAYLDPVSQRHWARDLSVTLDKRLREILTTHDYPGNVRELDRILRDAVAIATSESRSDKVHLTLRHLPPSFRRDWVAGELQRGTRRRGTNVRQFSRGVGVSVEESRVLDEIEIGSVEGVRVVAIARRDSDAPLVPTGARRIPTPQFSDWQADDRALFSEFVLRGGTVTAGAPVRLQPHERYVTLDPEAEKMVRSNIWTTKAELESALIAAATDVSRNVLGPGHVLTISAEALRRYRPDGADSAAEVEFSDRVEGAIRILKDRRHDGAVTRCINAMSTLDGDDKSTPVALLAAAADATEMEAFAALMCACHRCWRRHQKSRQLQADLEKLLPRLWSKQATQKRPGAAIEAKLKELNYKMFKTDNESASRRLFIACTEFEGRTAVNAEESNGRK